MQASMVVTKGQFRRWAREWFPDLRKDQEWMIDEAWRRLEAKRRGADDKSAGGGE